MNTTNGFKLSTRQREIMELLIKGYSNAEIGKQLQPRLSEGAVKQHLCKIYRKMDVNNRIEAMNEYQNV